MSGFGFGVRVWGVRFWFEGYTRGFKSGSEVLVRTGIMGFVGVMHLGL